MRGADEIYDGPKKNVTTKASNENTRQDAQSLSTLNNVIFIDTADLERQTAAMAMRASELILIQLMACGDSLHEAFKVANQAQTLCIIARRTIPKRVVKSRWRPQNHAERATVQNLEAAELHGRNQHLSDLTEYSKISFRRAVPVSRRVGNEVANIIAELVALGASPTQGA